MATYLVTGGAGFIGSHVVERLLARGDRVRVLDDLTTGHRANVPAGVEVVAASILDRAAVDQAIADVDGCFHLAAIASNLQSVIDWPGTHRVNITGTIEVLDAAARRAAGKIPVIYASSSALYGSNDQLPLSETSTPMPTTAYAVDKLACEWHAKIGHDIHGMSTIGFRFFNVYGPRQDPKSPYTGVISIFAERLMGRQDVQINGDGEQSRDFVYVGDIADLLIAGMGRAEGQTVCEVYNGCTGRATSLNELLATLVDITGYQPPVRRGEPRPGDIRHSLGDPSRARATLGVEAKVSLAQGLRETLAWVETLPGRAA